MPIKPTGGGGGPDPGLRASADASSATADAFAGTWFGSGLHAASRARFVSLAARRAFDAGAVVFRADEPTPHLGVVLGGRLGLWTHVAGRGDVTYTTVETGDVYGWSTLVAPHRSHADVRAITPAEVLAAPAEALRAALDADAEFAADLYHRMLAALGRRLSATRVQFLDLFESPVEAEASAPRGELSPRLGDVREVQARGG